MNQILNNLFVGEVLYRTSRGTNYTYAGRDRNQGVKYNINTTTKTLPLNTIIRALVDFQLGVNINSTWYRNFNQQEYRTRSCNLSVLRSLLDRTILE